MGEVGHDRAYAPLHRPMLTAVGGTQTGMSADGIHIGLNVLISLLGLVGTRSDQSEIWIRLLRFTRRTFYRFLPTSQICDCIVLPVLLCYASLDDPKQRGAGHAACPPGKHGRHRRGEDLRPTHHDWGRLHTVDGSPKFIPVLPSGPAQVPSMLFAMPIAAFGGVLLLNALNLPHSRTDSRFKSNLWVTH